VLGEHLLKRLKILDMIQQLNTFFHDKIKLFKFEFLPQTGTRTFSKIAALKTDSDLKKFKGESWTTKNSK